MERDGIIENKYIKIIIVASITLIGTLIGIPIIWTLIYRYEQGPNENAKAESALLAIIASSVNTALHSNSVPVLAHFNHQLTSCIELLQAGLSDDVEVIPCNFSIMPHREDCDYTGYDRCIKARLSDYYLSFPEYKNQLDKLLSNPCSAVTQEVFARTTSANTIETSTFWVDRVKDIFDCDTNERDPIKIIIYYDADIGNGAVERRTVN